VLEIVYKGFKAYEDVNKDNEELLGNAFCGHTKLLDDKKLNCGSHFNE